MLKIPCMKIEDSRALLYEGKETLEGAGACVCATGFNF
jgi:hypothetical protein